MVAKLNSELNAPKYLLERIIEEIFYWNNQPEVNQLYFDGGNLSFAFPVQNFLIILLLAGVCHATLRPSAEYEKPSSG